MNFILSYIGNFIIPTDFHIFQRGRYTTNQIYRISHNHIWKPGILDKVQHPAIHCLIFIFLSSIPGFLFQTGRPSLRIMMIY